MDRNVGGFDRRVRILAGIAVLGYALRTSGIKRVAALLAGADLFLTAALQRCPVNALLGVDTCRIGARSKTDQG